MIQRPSIILHLAAISCMAILNCQTIQAADPAEFNIFDYDIGNDGKPVRGDLPGRLYVPTDVDPNEYYPLVIFYCGSGEVLDSARSNLDEQVNGNIDNLLAAAKARKFYLYAPQSPGGWQYETVEKTISMAVKAADIYKIDRSKIYVTGLSLGGRGARCAFSHYADALAAAVPICSDVGQTENEFYEDLIGKPIWAFHAINDDQVSVSASRNLINNLRAADGKTTVTSWPINNSPNNPFYNNGSPYYSDGSTFLSFPDSPDLLYTEFASGKHGIWSSVFGGKTPGSPSMTYPLYDWLLSKSLPSGLPATLQPGETLLFDLGPTRIDPLKDGAGRYWNGNIYGHEKTLGAAVIPYAITADGYRTSVMMELISPFGGWHKRGVTSGAPYSDANIAWDGWQTVINATASTNPGIVRFKGFQPGALCRLKIWASDTDSDGGRGRDTRYEIASAVPSTADLSVYNNAAGTVTMYASANAAGAIDLKVYPRPGSTSRYGEISTVEITALETPASAWSLDETSGTTAADSTGLQPGTLQGNAVFTSGAKFGGGVSLDGTNDWVVASSQPQYSGSALTLSMWFKPALLDGQARGLISKRVGVFNQVAYSIFIHTGNRIFVDIGTGSGATIQRFDTGYTVSSLNTWHHLAVVFDGSLPANALKVYVNGGTPIFQAQPASATAILNTSAPLYLGTLNANYGVGFSGVIDQVRIYNSALGQNEVDLLNLY